MTRPSARRTRPTFRTANDIDANRTALHLIDVGLFFCVSFNCAATCVILSGNFMKLIFMGTPALAIPFLERLHEEHEIILVVTQPDKPAGRGRTLQAPPLKAWANEYSIAVAQPERARSEDFIAHLQTFQPDAIAVVAFGQILPRAILEMPRLGCLNAHFSLLPRWRGAAPVQHALIAGDTQTGVTIQHMAEKLDAGDIVLQRQYSIEPHETTADLWQKLTPIGADALSEALQLLENGTATRTPQDESQITLAPQLKREDGHLNWRDEAASIVNRVRGTNPWPGAWTTFADSTLKVWRAQVDKMPNAAASGAAASGAAGKVLAIDANGIVIAARNGAVRLLEVQSEGRPRLNAAAWARGSRLERGQFLGETISTGENAQGIANV